MQQTEKAMPKSKKKYTKIMVVLIAISFLSKICGFLRDIVLSNVYGASAVSDAYLATLSIPDMVFELLTYAIMMGFIPLAIEKLNESKDELNSFATSAAKNLLIMALVFCSFLALFSDVVVSVLMPGFEGESRRLAISFLRIISLTLIFRSVTSIFQSYLNVLKHFVPVAFLGIALDMTIVLAIIVSKQYQFIYFLPFGVLLGSILQTLLLLPFALKDGFRLKLRAPFFCKEIRALLVLSIPAVFASGLLHIANLFHRALASGLMTGGITLYSNAAKVSYSIENIIASSITTVLYPLFVEYYLSGEKDKIRDSIGEAVDKLIVFLLPASVGLTLLSKPIIGVLFGRGAFTEENVRVTAVLMSLSVFGMLGIAVQTLLTRALFSMKKVKLSVLVSLSLLVVYLGASFVFSSIWGLYGLSFSIGFSYTVGGLVYYIVLHKICGSTAKRTGITLIKALVASAVMALVVLLVGKIPVSSPILGLGLAVCFGAFAYFVVAQIVGLKHASAKSIFNKLCRK